MKKNEKLEEKLCLLEIYERCEITKRDFKQIIKLSKDKDDFIREKTAQLLVCLENHASKKLLLKLANDRNAWVRLDAYDSLAGFPFPEVAAFLQRAMFREKHSLACSYAIMAWAEVTQKLYDDHRDDLRFILRFKKEPKIRKSEHCLLACFYAEYLFGEKKSLKNILRFFSSEDYQVRYSVLHTLQQITDDTNRELILEKIEQAFKKETTLGLTKDLAKFWKQLFIEQNK